MAHNIRRIGLLTGGGDCPGLNAAIRAIVRSAVGQHGCEVVAFLDGFEGLVENRLRKLTQADVSGLLTTGGTIIGTSNRADPFAYPAENNSKVVDRSKDVIRNFKAHNLDVLIAIGGDGTTTALAQLSKLGLPVIIVPKTIDNDLWGTDTAIGFDSAVSIATDAIDKIHTTAQSHHRVMIIEVMGRYAGWLALASGLAGGGDVILLPEFPYSLQKIAEAIAKRTAVGRRFTIVVAGEGAHEEGGKHIVSREVMNSPERIRLGGVGQVVARDLEQLLTTECRVTVLGHLLRGGLPTAHDRLLATQLGHAAVKAALQGNSAMLCGIKRSDVVLVPLAEVAGKQKRVTAGHHWLQIALGMGVSFGVSESVLASQDTHLDQVR